MTTRKAADASVVAASNPWGKAVWRWELTGEAFGADQPIEDPDTDGKRFIFDVRFPGQRFDDVTGLHYNYFRDYDPAVGRYVQSDPIGLEGGVSTYGYVAAGVMTRVDPSGTTFEDVRRVNRQVNGAFPELQQRGMLRCGDLSDDLNGTTNRWTGDITVPRKFCERPCLTRDEWKELFWTLFHEGMHSTDPWSLEFGQSGEEEESWHDGIFNRESYESDHAEGIPLRNIRGRLAGAPMWGVPRKVPVDLERLIREFQIESGGCCSAEE